MIYKVTFHLDGTGIYYDPFEPPHLDALLAWCLSPIHRHCHTPLQRDDLPEEVPLPLRRLDIGETWIYRASALFPQGEQADALMYWRKRFRQQVVHWTTGSPNLQNGPYRDYNMPVPLLLIHHMIAWGDGNAKEARKLLKQIKHLGKKRAYGKGQVVGLEVEACDVQSVITHDNHALRWLPNPEGTRLVRPRPPYWNAVGRIMCCEIGDTWTRSDKTTAGIAL